MAYKIIYKAYAERDIWEIANYLSDHSITTTEKFLHTLKKKIEELTETPFMYPKINPYQEYRKMVIDNYVVAYVVDEQAKQVLIIRVVHGKRDYQNKI